MESLIENIFQQASKSTRNHHNNKHIKYEQAKDPVTHTQKKSGDYPVKTCVPVSEVSSDHPNKLETKT